MPQSRRICSQSSDEDDDGDDIDSKFENVLAI